MNSFPRSEGEKKQLQGIPGTLPDLVNTHPAADSRRRCLSRDGPLYEVDPDAA